MAVIETVSIEDVYPIEDEYGNDLATRDYSLKANKDYVERLADKMRAKGVPDEPVVLVRDGGIFRIKAGNSRVRAMRLLGTKKFEAVVEDESTLRDVIETVIRTDTKKTYEEQELADFTRQLMLFDKDDESVAATLGVPVERARRIRSGARRQGEAVDQMTTDWMEAVGEFEGDPDAQAKLVGATAKTWAIIASNLRDKRRFAEWSAEMTEALAARGVEVGSVSGLRYVDRIGKPAQAAEFDFPEGSVATLTQYCGFKAEIYAPTTDTPEKAEAKRRSDEVSDLMDEATAAREEWLSEHILDLDGLGPLMELPGESSTPYWHGIGSMMAHLRDDWPKSFGDAINSYLGSKTYGFSMTSEDGGISEHSAARIVRLTDALEKCGYEPPEAEQRLYQMCKDALEGGSDE